MARTKQRHRDQKKRDAAKASASARGGGAAFAAATVCKPPNLPSKREKKMMLTKKQLIRQEKLAKKRRDKANQEDIASLFGPLPLRRQQPPRQKKEEGQEQRRAKKNKLKMKNYPPRYNAQQQQHPFTVVVDGVPLHHNYRSPINGSKKKKKQKDNNNRQQQQQQQQKGRKRKNSKPPFQLKTIHNPRNCIVPWWNDEKRKEWVSSQSKELIRQKNTNNKQSTAAGGATTTTSSPPSRSSSSGHHHYLFGSRKNWPNEAWLVQLDAELEAFANYVQLSTTEIDARNYVVQTLENLAKYNLDIVKSDPTLSQDDIHVQVFGSFATPSVCAFCSDVDMALYGIVPPPIEPTHIRFNTDDKAKSSAAAAAGLKKPPPPPSSPLDDKVQKWRDLLRECDENNNNNDDDDAAAAAGLAISTQHHDDEEDDDDDDDNKRAGWQNALDQLLDLGGANNCDVPDYRGRSDSCISSSGGSYSHHPLRSDSNVSGATTGARAAAVVAGSATEQKEDEVEDQKPPASAKQQQQQQQSSSDGIAVVDLLSDDDDDDEQEESPISMEIESIIEYAANSMSTRLEDKILDLLAEHHPDGLTANTILKHIPGIEGYIRSCGYIRGTRDYISPVQLLSHCCGVLGKKVDDGGQTTTKFFLKTKNTVVKDEHNTTTTTQTQPECAAAAAATTKRPTSEEENIKINGLADVHNNDNNESEDDRKPAAKLIHSPSTKPPTKKEVIDVDQLYEDAEEETVETTTTAGAAAEEEQEFASQPPAAAAASEGVVEEADTDLFVIDRIGAGEVVDLNSENENESGKDDTKKDGHDGNNNNNNMASKNDDDDDDDDEAFTKMQNPRKRSQSDIMSSGSDSEEDTADKLASLHARKRSKPSPSQFEDAPEEEDDDDDVYYNPQAFRVENAEQAVISLSSDDDEEGEEEEDDDDGDMHVSFINNPEPTTSLKSFGPQGDVRIQVVNGLSALGSVLRKRPFTKSVQVIKGARVPIIKFETKLGFEGDVAMGGHNGTDTSQFAMSQVAKFESFATVVMALKIMLRQQGLDTPFIGGLGSYKLYVLVAYHLERHLELGGCDRPSEVFLSFLYRYGINRGSGILDRSDNRSRTFLQLSTTLECEGGYTADLSAVFLVKHCVDLFKRCFMKIGQENIYKKAPKQGSSILEDLFDVEQLVEDRTFSMEKASLLHQFCKKTKREKAAKEKRDEKAKQKHPNGRKKMPKGSRQQNQVRYETMQYYVR